MRQDWPLILVEWHPVEMADNRIARGIVLVPCLLLGGAFLATAIWGQGGAEENQRLAGLIGIGLLLAGGLSQLGSDRASTDRDVDDDLPEP